MDISIKVPDNIFYGINESKDALANMLKEKLALELYKSHKISLTQGAKLLSLDIYEFINLLKRNDIAVIDDYDATEVEIAKRLLK
jgi:predicted HTH domain antitoxin